MCAKAVELQENDLFENYLLLLPNLAQPTLPVLLALLLLPEGQ